MIQWQDEHFQACAQAQEHLANPNQAHSESYEEEEEMGRVLVQLIWCYTKRKELFPRRSQAYG